MYIVCRLSLNIDARGEINWLFLNVFFVDNFILITHDNTQCLNYGEKLS